MVVYTQFQCRKCKLSLVILRYLNNMPDIPYYDPLHIPGLCVKLTTSCRSEQVPGGQRTDGASGTVLTSVFLGATCRECASVVTR